MEEEREELQMPELSRGKYLHDFKVRTKYLFHLIPFGLKPHPPTTSLILNIYMVLDEQNGHH